MLFFTAMPRFNNYISSCTVFVFLIMGVEITGQNIGNEVPGNSEIMLILEKKCNDCHAKEKRKYVFTPENLNGFAGKINKEVFIKKRMPKGNETKLSEAEWIRLKKWVDSVLVKKNK